jgi:AAA family ATP:ADP antiporter
MSTKRASARPLYWVLRWFTDIREGEANSALLMSLNVFLILCAYYFIKPLREGWIAVSDIGGLEKMEVKAYSSFGQSLLLLPVVWGYGRLAARWDRSALITRATLFCMSNMLIFWMLQPDFFIANLPYTGIAFYLWVGMFGVFVVAQFFAFAADVYTDEQGERLLPLVALGATAGAAFGSTITVWLVETVGLGSNWLLVVAILPLAVSIALTRAVDRRERRADPGEGRPSPAATGRGPSAMALVFSSRFLVAVAFITMLLSWVNTNGENLLFRVVQEFLAGDATARGIAAGEPMLNFTRNGTTVFYGDFFSWVNGVALLLQAFVASRILKYGGFGPLLLMMPAVALLSYSAMALIPVLAIVKAMKIAENATDYSINNTARHVLWLPVDSETKYKGKTTIDTFFVRAGDGLAALTVLVGVQVLALPTKSFFVINVGLVVIWLALALVVVQEYGRLSQGGSAREAT